jgi:tRNA dimethylallyltransferase
MNKELIVIAGPTGIGKTELGIEIAQRLKTEIISADSRQIYKELSIGTAVPSQNQLAIVPHHFIQNKSIHEYYNASKYENEVIHLLGDLFKKYNQIIMVGGSGMYIDAVRKGIDELPEIDMELRKSLFKRLEEEGLESLRKELKVLDPVSYEKIDLKNPKRVQKALEISLMTGKPYSSFMHAPEKPRDFKIKLIALDMKREELYKRINQRVIQMIEKGLVEEAKSLKSFKSVNALKTVGYKEIFTFLDQKISLEEAIEKIQANTRKYARKQLTWFRKENNYQWFHPYDLDGIYKLVSDEK